MGPVEIKMVPLHIGQDGRIEGHSLDPLKGQPVRGDFHRHPGRPGRAEPCQLPV